MASLAKVTLVGNLGRDPDTRYTPNGTMNVSFNVATSRKWNDQAGQLQERTTWFHVTAWGRLAEALDRLHQAGALVKGKQVLVLGTIEQREYEGRQGEQRASLEVNADEVQLLGTRDRAEPDDAQERNHGHGYDDIPF